MDPSRPSHADTWSGSSRPRAPRVRWGEFWFICPGASKAPGVQVGKVAGGPRAAQGLPRGGRQDRTEGPRDRPPSARASSSLLLEWQAQARRASSFASHHQEHLLGLYFALVQGAKDLHGESWGKGSGGGKSVARVGEERLLVGTRRGQRTVAHPCV